ncbi:YqaA family protein [Pseudomonadota bacterium]
MPDFINDWLSEWGLWGLLGSAFISSTLLPGGSEAILLALMLNGSHNELSLLSIATIGNTLGGMTSWLLGWYLANKFSHKSDTNSELNPARQRAIERVRRWGSPVLLLSWLPVIGDPLCVAAGWLKIPPLLALVLIAVGKGGRYAMLLWMMSPGTS